MSSLIALSLLNFKHWFLIIQLTFLLEFPSFSNNNTSSLIFLINWTTSGWPYILVDSVDYFQCFAQYQICFCLDEKVYSYPKEHCSILRLLNWFRSLKVIQFTISFFSSSHKETQFLICLIALKTIFTILLYCNGFNYLMTSIKYKGIIYFLIAYYFF